MDIGTILRDILTVGGIAGVVALILTLGLVIRYVKHGPEEIPEAFTVALATIIGFYFGSGVSGAIGQ